MENIWLLSIVVAFILFFFLLSGQWVGLALATTGILIMVFLTPKVCIQMVGRLQFNMANSFVLGAVPLFIFMGYILIHSRLSDLVYRAVTPIVSQIPGGLLHTNVVAGSLFGATCGTSTAGTAAVGTVAIPQLKRRGYDKQLTYGSVAAGGTMSALIPPSVALYGEIALSGALRPVGQSEQRAREAAKLGLETVITAAGGQGKKPSAVAGLRQMANVADLVAYIAGLPKA